MIASFDENGASIHFNPAELRDIIRLTGAMNNPNAVHLETQIFIDLFKEIMDSGIVESFDVESLNAEELQDVFHADRHTPSKEERALDF